MGTEEVTAGECPTSFPKPVLPRPSAPGNPQRHSVQRCHQPRVLPLLLLQPPSCYRQRRGKIAFENPTRKKNGDAGSMLWAVQE